MTTTLRVNLTVTLDDRNFTFASYTTGTNPAQGEAELSVDGEYDTIRKSVAASATATLWDVSTSPLADFDFAAFVCVDGDGELECVIDDAATVGEVVHVVKLKKGIPFVLPSDDSRASNHTVDWGADGTAETYDQFNFKNTGSSAVQVEGIVIT